VNRPAHRGGLVNHGNRSSQQVSIRDTQRLAKACVETTVGSDGDSYDIACAETINGHDKAEVHQPLDNEDMARLLPAWRRGRPLDPHTPAFHPAKYLIPRERMACRRRFCTR
jgi:hypothetical protein